MSQVEISVVAPMHNEEDNARPLYEAIKRVMDNLGAAYEIIFVNDCSSDKTLEVFKNIQKNDPRFHYCDLEYNVGENWSLLAGVSKAQGKIIVTIDGDYQNDPKFIPDILKKLGEGYKVVSGWRRKRAEGFWDRALPSLVANYLISRISGVAVHDCGCGLKAYKREVLEGRYVPKGFMNRFSPVAFGVKGNEFAEVEITDRLRQFGTSHYGLKRVFIVFNDLLALPFILRGPGKMIGLIRFLIFLSALFMVFFGIEAIFYHQFIFSLFIFIIVFLMFFSIQWNLKRFIFVEHNPLFKIKEFK